VLVRILGVVDVLLTGFLGCGIFYAATAGADMTLDPKPDGDGVGESTHGVDFHCSGGPSRTLCCDVSDFGGTTLGGTFLNACCSCAAGEV